MRHRHTQLAALAAALLSTSALASVATVKTMSDKSIVTITGYVESVDNEEEFTLRDTSGMITVDMESGQSVVLKQGDKVTVTGKVDKGILGTDINATNVSVHKDVVSAIGDAIEGHTPVSFEGATAYNIGELPKAGVVKVSGTVTDVDSEKEFTLKDATGTVHVDIESAESASLKEGAQVTVIGRVDAGSKDITADKVIVKSNS